MIISRLLVRRLFDRQKLAGSNIYLYRNLCPSRLASTNRIDSSRIHISILIPVQSLALVGKYAATGWPARLDGFDGSRSG